MKLQQGEKMDWNKYDLNELLELFKELLSGDLIDNNVLENYPDYFSKLSNRIDVKTDDLQSIVSDQISKQLNELDRSLYEKG
tara:strand:+ start:524 stop:769 length:246 start_codon:yes stop_codon:yes gene_type:complete